MSSFRIIFHPSRQLISLWALSEYSAFDWIVSDYPRSWYMEMQRMIPNVANTVLSNYMVDAMFCDTKCLITSMEVISSRARITTTRWLDRIMTEGRRVPTDPEERATLFTTYAILANTRQLQADINYDIDWDAFDNTVRACRGPVLSFQAIQPRGPRPG